jgi:hypothetical protein
MDIGQGVEHRVEGCDEWMVKVFNPVVEEDKGSWTGRRLWSRV